MMKISILLASALMLLATSNIVGADSVLHSAFSPPQPQPSTPYEPSPLAMLLIVAGLLLLRMRSSYYINDKFSR